MKVTLGGSIGYKIQGKPYESIDIMSICTIDIEDEKVNIEEVYDKIRETIKSENRKKLKLAIEEYKNKLEEIRRL
jgi:hypothetical protein